MSARPINTPAEVDELVHAILAPERAEAIVALTSRKQQTAPAIPPAEVRAELGDEPTIVTLADGPLTRKLADLLTPELAVYGGAARIWWPGTTRESDPHAHPLVFERHGVYGTLALERLAAAYRRGPAADSRRGGEQVPRAALETEARARQNAEARIGALTQELEAANREIRTLRADIAEERERSRELRRRLRSQESDGRGEPRGAGASEESLRHAIDSAADELREERELTPYVVGPRFAESVREVDVPVDRIAWVCAFVLARPQADLASLDLHPLRTGPGGADPQRARQPDGAKAWRIAVRRGTPGAPRLHFWRLPDGSVEFATVGHHDDMDIR